MARLDGDMNDSLTVLTVEESSFSTQESTPSSSKDSKKLTEKDGEIGYYKNGFFYPMTNFSLHCVGYVVDRIGSTSANGFLFRVLPNDCVNTDGEDDTDGETGYDLHFYKIELNPIF